MIHLHGRQVRQISGPKSDRTTTSPTRVTQRGDSQRHPLARGFRSGLGSRMASRLRRNRKDGPTQTNIHWRRREMPTHESECLGPHPQHRFTGPLVRCAHPVCLAAKYSWILRRPSRRPIRLLAAAPRSPDPVVSSAQEWPTPQPPHVKRAHGPFSELARTASRRARPVRSASPPPQHSHGRPRRTRRLTLHHSVQM